MDYSSPGKCRKPIHTERLAECMQCQDVQYGVDVFALVADAPLLRPQVKKLKDVQLLCTDPSALLYFNWRIFSIFLCLDVNQYRVTVQSTEASRRCQLAGDYLVSPDKHAVTLLAISTGHIIYRWPYMFIRKFGQVEVRYSLKIGRDKQINSKSIT